MKELEPLFYWRGIASDYYNFRGELVQIPYENKLGLLSAMGVDLSSDDAISKEIFDLDVAPWMSLLPKLQLSSINCCAFEVNLSPNQFSEKISWRVLDSKGAVRVTGDCYASELTPSGDYTYRGATYKRFRVPLGELSPNYYQIDLLLSSGVRAESVLAVTPRTAYAPLSEGKSGKVWGTIIQLYTMRSERNWGIGDFTDLKNLVSFLSNKGADVIGLNPLHALTPYLDDTFSPYSPSDRRFLNPLYLDVEKVEGFDASSLSDGAQSEIVELRQLDFVDYSRVANLKYTELFKLYLSMPLSVVFSAAFDAYIRGWGEPLLNFALYESRNNRYINSGEDSASLDFFTETDFSQSITALKNGKHRTVTFHIFLQWLAEQQLEAVQEFADSMEMKIGLVKDLAVGANPSGAEVATNPNLFCKSASVGAPPDPMALTGQNWGIPPMDPATLTKSGFDHFINLLRANMSQCGALRIDHAMSIMRLWWCPPGKNASEGAYVKYPFEQMLGLLRLESHLNKCMVIGEDLGVVPDEFRVALSDAKIYSNKVFYFEKEFDGSFRHPKNYAEHALAMVDNHDVPTLKSWWEHTDLALRNELNMLEEGVSYEDVVNGRKYEKRKLLEMLVSEKLFNAEAIDATLESEFDFSLLSSVLKLASTARSQIFVIQLEDLMLMDAPVNVPGTYREYPNWQRKLSQSLETVISSERVNSLLSDINNIRKG